MLLPMPLKFIWQQTLSLVHVNYLRILYVIRLWYLCSTDRYQPLLHSLIKNRINFSYSSPMLFDSSKSRPSGSFFITTCCFESPSSLTSIPQHLWTVSSIHHLPLILIKLSLIFRSTPLLANDFVSMANYSYQPQSLHPRRSKEKWFIR